MDRNNSYITYLLRGFHLPCVSLVPVNRIYIDLKSIKELSKIQLQLGENVDTKMWGDLYGGLGCFHEKFLAERRESGRTFGFVNSLKGQTRLQLYFEYDFSSMEGSELKKAEFGMNKGLKVVQKKVLGNLELWMVSQTAFGVLGQRAK